MIWENWHSEKLGNFLNAEIHPGLSAFRYQDLFFLNIVSCPERRYKQLRASEGGQWYQRSMFPLAFHLFVLTRQGCCCSRHQIQVQGEEGEHTASNVHPPAQEGKSHPNPLPDFCLLGELLSCHSWQQGRWEERKSWWGQACWCPQTKLTFCHPRSVLAIGKVVVSVCSTYEEQPGHWVLTENLCSFTSTFKLWWTILTL